MEVNTRFAGGYYSAYRSASKVTEKRSDRNAAAQTVFGSVQTESAGKEELYDQQATGETLSAADVFRMLKDTLLEEHKLTKDDIEHEDDWRKMSDDQWDKLIEQIDRYIDDFKEELQKMEELQKEAAAKGAANAPADRKAVAASKAALRAAANGIVGEAPDHEADSSDRSSWTYNLRTEDQVILTTAKAANEFAYAALTKAQELALTGDTTAGVCRTENARECASLDEKDEKKKTWTITVFTEQGILCRECTGGDTEELWRITYENPGDYQKVWDFLDKLDRDSDVKFAGSKSFWENFLLGL